MDHTTAKSVSLSASTRMRCHTFRFMKFRGRSVPGAVLNNIKPKNGVYLPTVPDLQTLPYYVKKWVSYDTRCSLDLPPRMA